MNKRPVFFKQLRQQRPAAPKQAFAGGDFHQQGFGRGGGCGGCGARERHPGDFGRELQGLPGQRGERVCGQGLGRMRILHGLRILRLRWHAGRGVRQQRDPVHHAAPAQAAAMENPAAQPALEGRLLLG